MAIDQRPGVYTLEKDNTISLVPGGLGGIGIAARLDKGDVGKVMVVNNRTDLVRLGGKPIVRFNTEDWNYIDNIFYYAGNVILSRVEDVDHSYRPSDASIVLPCQNSQVVIHNKGGSYNPNLKFSYQAIFKVFPTASAERLTMWNNFLTDFLGGEDNIDSIDLGFLILNSLRSAQEKYEEDVTNISRTMNLGVIELERDEYGEFTSTATKLLTLKDGAIILQNDGSGNVAIAQISNIRKILSIHNDYFYNPTLYWPVGARVFTITRKVVGSESALPAGTYVIDENSASPYFEIGRVVAVETGDVYQDVDIEYTTSTTLRAGDVIIALTQEEIDAADGIYEREKILNALQTIANKELVDPLISLGNELTGTPGRTWSGGVFTEGIAFNYVNLHSGKSIRPTTLPIPPTTLIVNYDTLIETIDETDSITLQLGPTAPGTNLQYELFRVTAKNPGKWADRDDIRVLVCDMNNFDEYAAQYFDYKPAAGEGTTYRMDQLAVVVWVDGSIVEKYIASLNSSAKDSSGVSMYFDDMINKTSQYIRLTVAPGYTDKNGFHPFYDVDAGYVFIEEQIADYVPEIVQLRGGSSSTRIRALAISNNTDYSVQWSSVQAVKEALRLFEDKSGVSIEYLADGAFAGQPQIKDELKRIAVLRGDCVAIVGPKSTTFQGVAYPAEGYDRLAGGNSEGIDYRTWATASTDNQYIAFYANTKQVYDSINDQTQWISCSSDAVGINANIDRNQERWFAAAGPRRGVITNVLKLGFYANDTVREQMTKDRFNPIIFIREDGNVIYDTMSLCTLNSDLCELYNRKTLNYLKVNTERYLRRVLFEFNDEATRLEVVASVTPFYRSVYNRRGLLEPALIQCDAKNNPSSVVAANMMYVDFNLKLPHVAKRIVARYQITKATATLEFVTEQ